MPAGQARRSPATSPPSIRLAARSPSYSGSPRFKRCSGSGSFVRRDEPRGRLQLRVEVDKRVTLRLDLVLTGQQGSPYISDLFERLALGLSRGLRVGDE